MISPCRLPTCLLMKAKKGLLESSLRTIALRLSLGTIAPRSCRLYPVFHRCQCFYGAAFQLPDSSSPIPEPHGIVLTCCFPLAWFSHQVNCWNLGVEKTIRFDDNEKIEHWKVKQDICLTARLHFHPPPAG